ncbi:type-2 ice-structuring protein-like [Scomber scombrus]|uniref:type-2 ice-structuring protein-like n=1 Tax=Scomber scombrus TaxID=13677 RepID=UPI002DD84315|nr:type-2 ice-structuring protein-like [Scomber scombrus]
MKMLTVFFFICVMMALTPTADCWTIPPTTVPPWPDHHLPSFSCPDGWTMFSMYCFLYVPTKMTWDEAETNCRRRSHSWPANLASVFDSEAAHDIREVLKSAGHEHGKVWVGGHRTTQNPSWSWNDMLGFNSFHDFCSVDHKHHCLHLTFEENEAGCLDDMDCETKLPSVCGVILM